MPREAFLYLLKHEMKWNRDRQKKNRWVWIYALLGMTIGLTFFTIVIRSGQFKLEYMWFFTYGVPFVLMGMSYGSISKEWKNRMYGWWLSLPYSRTQLVQTKFLAAWLQSLIVLMGSFGFLVIFSMYAVLVSENFTFQLILQQLVNGLPWFIVILAFYPIVAALSFLTFISAHTKFRPITPLLWIILIIALNSLYWFVRPVGEATSEIWLSSMFTVHFSSIVIATLIGTWLLAWGILKLSIRWIEREIIV